jgi:hypothetical protein
MRVKKPGFLLAPFFLIFLAAAAFAEDAPYAEVLSLSGPSQALIAPSTTWAQAKTEMQLYSGDSIRTGDAAYVELAFNEDNVVKIDADSSVVVLLKDEEKIELLNGEVFCTVANLPRGSSFVVRTPVGVVGARGTDWLTKVAADQMSVESYEGSPFVKNIEKDGNLSKEEMLVPPGSGTNFSRFRKPPVPVKLSGQEIKRWQAWKSDLKPRLNNAVILKSKQGGRLGGDKRLPVQKGLKRGPEKRNPGKIDRPEKVKPDNIGHPEKANPKKINRPPDNKKPRKGPPKKRAS